MQHPMGLKWPAALVACIVASGGCAAAYRGARQFTYPPDFHYIESEQLGSLMDRMAVDVLHLDATLRKNELTKDDQKRVVSLLQSIAKAANELDTPGQPSNHPYIDSNIAAFRNNVMLAVDQAQASPPNYFLAGSIVGSCLYCHGHGGT